MGKYDHLERLSRLAQEPPRPVDLKPSSSYLVGDDCCHADRDGDCYWTGCPQIKDGEPHKSGRHCPLDNWKDDED